MIRSLWIAKTGMEAQQTALDVISNNLANSGTNGYKSGRAVFEDLIYQNLRQVGANSGEQTTLPTGLQIGLGVRSGGSRQWFFPDPDARWEYSLHPRRRVSTQCARSNGDQ